VRSLVFSFMNIVISCGTVQITKLTLSHPIAFIKVHSTRQLFLLRVLQFALYSGVGSSIIPNGQKPLLSIRNALCLILAKCSDVI